VALEDLLELTRERFGADPSLEARIDAYVERNGGSREEMMDPWSAPLRGLRRIVGKTSPSRDIWTLPPGFFD
jgi:hypothetical protein